jgi:sec-independent protein translocase protein TatA
LNFNDKDKQTILILKYICVIKLNKMSILNTLLIGMPGGSEWILILLAVLLLFGGKKIPELMRGLGRGMREFKDAKDNIKSEIESGIHDQEK